MLSAHYATLLDQARDIVLLIGADGSIVEANQAAAAAYGRSVAELRSMNVSALRVDAAQPQFARDWKAAADARGTLFETVHRRADGSSFPVEVSSRAIEIDGTLYRQSFVRDITDRKRQEEALRRADRALRALIACNHALARASGEVALVAEVCTLLVEQGGYRMAWVGRASDDPQGTIVPLAHAGHEEGYLAAAAPCWTGGPARQGPTGTAIAEYRCVVVQDLAAETTPAAWRNAARARGYGAALALPMRVDDGTRLASLTLFAAAAGASTTTRHRCWSSSPTTSPTACGRCASARPASRPSAACAPRPGSCRRCSTRVPRSSIRCSWSATRRVRRKSARTSSARGSGT